MVGEASRGDVERYSGMLQGKENHLDVRSPDEVPARGFQVGRLRARAGAGMRSAQRRMNPVAACVGTQTDRLS